MSGRHAFRLLAVCAAAPLLAGCRGGATLSAADELRYGTRAAAAVEAVHPVDASSEEYRRAQAIAGRLAAADPEFPGPVRVLADDVLGTAAAPGACLYVHRGLIRASGADDAVIAAAVAHEGGHVRLRHAARQISQMMTTDAAIAFFLRGGEARANDQAASLLALAYDTKEEMEADAWALRALDRAGFDPRGLLRLQKLVESAPDRLAAAYKQGHPPGRSRTRRVMRVIESQDHRTGR